MSIFTFNPVIDILVGTEVPLGEEGIIFTVKAVKHLPNSLVAITFHNDFSSCKEHQVGFDLSFKPTQQLHSCIPF